MEQSKSRYQPTLRHLPTKLPVCAFQRHGTRFVMRALPAPGRETLLLLSTDGYSKSYSTDAAFQQIGPDYLDLVRKDGVCGLNLRGFLEQVTAQGAGDDIGLALLYWLPLASQTAADSPAALSDSTPLIEPNRTATERPTEVESDESSQEGLEAKSNSCVVRWFQVVFGKVVKIRNEMSKTMEKLQVQKQKLELQKLPDETRITARHPCSARGAKARYGEATDGGHPVAVKVYHLHTASPEQKEALERLVAKGQPAPHFLWPMAMVKDVQSERYGYIMALREPNFRGLEEFMARADPAVNACIAHGWNEARRWLPPPP